VSAVRPGWFDDREVKTLSSTEMFPEGASLRDGDLLITRANTRELVGSVCRVVSAPPRYFLCDKTLRLNPREELVSADYLLEALQSQDARRQIENVATGTSGSMKNISQDSIRALRVPVLDRPQQDAWANTVRGARELERSAAALISELQLLRSTLLSDLLSGQHEIPNTYDALLSA